MRLFFILIILLQSASKQAFSQMPVVIKGEILDEAGIGITNCYIKIADNTSRIIYKYQNTGDKNIFSFSISPTSADTIALTVSHVSYKDTVLKIPLPPIGGAFFKSIILSDAVNKLNDVIIKGPPVWVRGDTTFYKIDAFKEGGEKKLKDIIVNIPGFEITNEGQLLYKKQPINKIMIDGEELFADKLDLMLNNFPIHVISTIQAVQNQSRNKLLKGITDDGLVFLNLGLNKSKLKAAFGDGEAGAGTESRYVVTPVIFSMFGKFKAGFVGNWNNIGKGVTHQQESELKNHAERTSEKLLINNHPIQILNNFESFRYIRNNIWDNRLQINIPVSNKIKSQTEITFLKDRQRQNTQYQSSFYNANIFFARTDTNNVTFLPELANIRQQIIWDVDSLTELKFQATSFRDRSVGHQNTIYLTGVSRDVTDNLITNNWNSFSLRTDYTRRINSAKAVSMFVFYNNQSERQNGKGTSADYPEIFNLPDTSFTSLIHLINNKFRLFGAGYSQMKKTKAGIKNVGVVIEHLQYSLNKYSFLENIAGRKFSADPLLEILPGNYMMQKVSFNYKQSVKIWLKKPFVLDANIGFANVSIDEDKEKPTSIIPIYKISLFHKHTLFKIFTSQFNGSFSQEPVAPYSLFGNFYPTTITSFQRTANVHYPIKNIKLNYAFAWGYPKDAASGSVSTSFSRQLSGLVSFNEFNRFVNFRTDSILTAPSDNYHVSAHHSLPSLLLNAMINFDGGLFVQNSVIPFKDELLRRSSSFYYLHFSLKKNWNRKYFIQLKISCNSYRIKLPEKMRGSIQPNISNAVFTLAQRVPINRHMNIISTLSFYRNNIFTPNRANFLFTDIEYNLKLPNKSWFLVVRGENLANEEKYYNFQNSELSQSFSTIPLIPRNLFISLRLTF